MSLLSTDLEKHQSHMQALLKQFENKKPEIVFEWHDAETEAEGWVVINSLRGGAAGGGTRMRKGLDKREVESLAKTMEVKFTVSGPAIGGAKSGINFDPADPRKHGVLQRWYKAVFPLLKNYYGTGGDMNIDEIHEVIPITEEYGLWHPQEGVVNGHYEASEPQKIKKLGQLRMGVSKVVEDIHYTPAMEKKYTVADLITGYGVAESVRHYYALWKQETILDKKAIIQGWGNVGAAAAFYLSQQGVKIVGILDRNCGMIDTAGMDNAKIRMLMLNRAGNTLCADDVQPFDVVNEKIWQLHADIFIPAAASRLVTRAQLEMLQKAGLEVIACGANVPFNDPQIFFGNTTDYADNHFALLPDFIANCGMARVFAYLMDSNIEVTDEAIFNDTSKTIHAALKKCHQNMSDNKAITKTAFEIALQQLV